VVSMLAVSNQLSAISLFAPRVSATGAMVPYLELRQIEPGAHCHVRGGERGLPV